MEPKLINGDYVPDGLGGIVRCSGEEALLARVLFRLKAQRGRYPLMPELGSRLYLLAREAPASRASAALQYAAEALAPEAVEVRDVILSQGEGDAIVCQVVLDAQGRELTAELWI